MANKTFEKITILLKLKNAETVKTTLSSHSLQNLFYKQLWLVALNLEQHKFLHDISF